VIGTLRGMALAAIFSEIVDSLSDDWTDLEVDLRILDERRYIDASLMLVPCNPQPYSKHDWHWTGSGTLHRFLPPTSPSSCSTRPRLPASWRCARCAPAAWKSCRCGAGPNRSAASSSRCGPSSGGGAMARVVALVPDLLFGSRVQSDLRAAGHEVTLAGSDDALRTALPGADALVVDLTHDAARHIEIVRATRPATMPVLAFYSHVEADVRDLGHEAGFELVVPRSRMAREGPALVAQLLEAASGGEIE
jgi:hypothetical protein